MGWSRFPFGRGHKNMPNPPRMAVFATGSSSIHSWTEVGFNQTDRRDELGGKSDLCDVELDVQITRLAKAANSTHNACRSFSVTLGIESPFGPGHTQCSIPVRPYGSPVAPLLNTLGSERSPTYRKLGEPVCQKVRQGIVSVLSPAFSISIEAHVRTSPPNFMLCLPISR